MLCSISNVYATIGLSRGRATIIDATDAAVLLQSRWSCSANGYAVGKVDKRYTYMHRMICAPVPKGTDVDHINGDKLDNRSANLRLCSRSKNLANQRIRSGGVSRYKGVYQLPGRKNWGARITVDYTCYHLGYYETEEEAAKAYDKAAVAAHGAFARINDPDKDS